MPIEDLILWDYHSVNKGNWTFLCIDCIKKAHSLVSAHLMGRSLKEGQDGGLGEV